MNDQNQNSAIRLQSSAIVMAAIITGSGAVIAACIQTGLIGRLSDPPLAVSMVAPEPMPAPKPAPAMATFTGAIEPLPDFRSSQVQQVSATTVNKVVAEPPPALLPVSEVSKPAETTRTLVSPWAYLKGATPVDASADAAKPKKKTWDWSPVTRYFRGNN